MLSEMIICKSLSLSLQLLFPKVARDIVLCYADDIERHKLCLW